MVEAALLAVMAAPGVEEGGVGRVGGVWAMAHMGEMGGLQVGESAGEEGLAAGAVAELELARVMERPEEGSLAKVEVAVLETAEVGVVTAMAAAVGLERAVGVTVAAEGRTVEGTSCSSRRIPTKGASQPGFMPSGFHEAVARVPGNALVLAIDPAALATLAALSRDLNA
ncbi:hypothetical protein AB1Y20_012476 [Prymnesium parvum]|uniref:Uncharacterized protein n=1 Tax=Prymnesium parvum TaxID=97485 RepID=A0AB34IKE7_PRYPA